MKSKPKRSKAKRTKPRPSRSFARRGGAIALGLGATALSVGVGLAAERWLVGRRRLRPDPHAREDYGQITGDRSYEVASFDGAVLVADEVGPPTATAGAVFLHGYCLNRTIWHHQYRGGVGSHRLIFYDARDHGRSRGGNAPAETTTLAADLKAVLDRSGLAQVVLIGHSMGGMTVLEYCRQYPDDLGSKIKGVVLANTTYTDALKTVFAAELVGPLERGLRRGLESVFDDPRASRAMRLRGGNLSWLLTRLGGFGPDASTKQVEFVQRLITSFPSPPLIEIMRGLRRFDFQDALEAIEVPTLVLAGGADRITTVRASKKIANDIPGARLFVFEDAGHMSMLERHDQFNSLVREFLDTNLVSQRRTQRPRRKRETA